MLIFNMLITFNPLPLCPFLAPLTKPISRMLCMHSSFVLLAKRVHTPQGRFQKRSVVPVDFWFGATGWDVVAVNRNTICTGCFILKID